MLDHWMGRCRLNLEASFFMLPLPFFRTAALSDGVEVNLRATVAKLADAGLRQCWSTNRKKPLRPATLTALLTLYFDCCEEPHKALHSMTEHVMADLLDAAVSANSWLKIRRKCC